MITRDQLEQFKAAPFLAAAEHLNAASEAVNTSQNQGYEAAGTMAYWSGATADAANQALGNANAAAMDAVAPLSGAGEVVQSFVAAVLLQQENFNNAMASVRALKWPSGEAQVGQDGSITKPPPPVVPPKPTIPSEPTPFEQGHLGVQPSPEANPNVGQYGSQLAHYNQQVQDYDTWQAASQQAAKLETDLKNALQAAEAADKRAHGDLTEGIKAAADFKVVLAKGLSAPQGEDLYNLGNSLSAAGTKWSQQDAANAAKLAKQAANNPAAAAELQQVYGNIVKDDNVFATSFLNTLGAKGLLTLANARANADQSDANNQPGDSESEADIQADRDLDGFLYNALANGTALTGASDDPGGPDHVSSSYLSALEQAGQASEDGDPGYYGLGQIFAAAQNGDVPMSTTLATTVGSNMIGWVRDTGSYNVGPADDTNPLLGLVNAASLSQSSAQALLLAPLQHANGSTVTGNGSGNNLSWLLSSGFTQNGTIVAEGNGGPLGQLIDVAGAGNGSNAQSITKQTVSELSNLYQTNSSYSQNMSGLDEPIASLLADHSQYIYALLASGGSIGAPGGGGLFDLQDFARVSGVISQDPSAYSTLQTGLVNTIRGKIDGAAANWQATGNSTEFLSDVQTGSGILTFIDYSRGSVATSAANAQAANFLRTLSVIENVSQIASAVPDVPEISVPAGVLEGAVGLGATFVTPPDTTTPTDNAILTIPNTMNYLAANAVLKYPGLSGSINKNFQPSTGGFAQGNGMLDPTKISAGGYANLGAWVNGQPLPSQVGQNPNWQPTDLPGNNMFPTIGSAVSQGMENSYVLGHLANGDQ